MPLLSLLVNAILSFSFILSLACRYPRQNGSKTKVYLGNSETAGVRFFEEAEASLVVSIRTNVFT